MPKSIFRHFTYRRRRERREEVASFDDERSFPCDFAVNDDESCEDSFSQLRNTLNETTDSVLIFLVSSCISRLSQRELERFLIPHTDEFRATVNSIWNVERFDYTVLFFCNACGRRIEKKEECCGPAAKFVRVGAFQQVARLVAHYLDDILNVRRVLRSGTRTTHNLASSFLKRRWQSDASEKDLNLSCIVSVDGVAVPGNRKKIWPISATILDLKTSDMQKSSNVILEGIVECEKNPSTTLWNAILPMVAADFEQQTGAAADCRFTVKIVSLSADQPAKRSFMGMRSHQASQACFYCLSPSTFYKDQGEARHEVRRGELSRHDSKRGVNGFGEVPSDVNNMFLPYETPLDVLHDLGEGFYEIVCNEIFERCDKRSDMFTADTPRLKCSLRETVIHSSFGRLEERRNGTDKLNFGRLNVSICALSTGVFSTRGSLVLVSAALLTNSLYSDIPIGSAVQEKLCGAVRWFLREASERYLVTKVHEFFYHLPYVTEQFGNTATLSTFAFESSYQFALLGFSSRLTRHYCEVVCGRVLLHNAVRKELERRSAVCASAELHKFLLITPGISSFEEKCSWPVETLSEEDVSVDLQGAQLFGRIALPCGTLKSELVDVNTSDDVFFTRSASFEWRAYRFVAVACFSTGNFALSDSSSLAERELPKASERSGEAGRHRLVLWARSAGNAFRIYRIPRRRIVRRCTSCKTSEGGIESTRIARTSRQGSRTAGTSRQQRERVDKDREQRERVDNSGNESTTISNSFLPVKTPKTEPQSTAALLRSENTPEYAQLTRVSFRDSSYDVDLDERRLDQENDDSMLLADERLIPAPPQVMKAFVPFGTTEEPESDGGTLQKKNPASSNGMWNMLEFARNYLYDKETGTPFSRSQCAENFKRMTRNWKELDYYQYLESASRFHGKDEEMEDAMLQNAVLTEAVNIVKRSLKWDENLGIPPEQLESTVQPNRGFSLEDAMNDESLVEFPSGKCFRISDALKVSDVARWTSTKIDVDARSLIRKVLNTVAPHDQFFAAYCPGAGNSSRRYHQLSEEFFYAPMIKFVINGFLQNDSILLQSRIHRMVHEVTAHFLDRLRKALSTKRTSVTATSLADDLRGQIERAQHHGRPLPHEQIIFYPPPTTSHLPTTTTPSPFH